MTFTDAHLQRTDFTEVESVRRRAANRITHRGIDRQVEVVALWIRRIRTGSSEFIATLPPAVLSDHDATIQRVIEAGFGAHRSVHCPDFDPIAVANASRSCGCRVQLDFRVEGSSAQTC